MSSMEVEKLDTKRDRLSDLPDDLLCRILSLLPMKDTVRASILSTRWKNLYTLVPTLNLEDYDHRGKRFMTTVDRVLFARKGIDVDKFLLRCGNDVDPLRAEGWVQYALWHNVRKLDLDLSPLHFMVPAGLFICNTLVSLKLSMDGTVLEIPARISLPSLKILSIMAAVFSDDNSVERLFSSCSTLEELVLNGCSFNGLTRLNVSNPNLKKLTISYYRNCYYRNCYYVNEVLINAPSLVYLKFDRFLAKNHLLIDLHSLVEAYIDFGRAPVTTDLIRGLRHIQSLHLSAALSRALLPGQDPIPTLENMTELRIGRFYLEGWERLLNFAPCLETLVFEELPFYENNIMNPPKEVPPCLISRIKTVKFLLFRGKKPDVQMVEYFLKHGQVLENLIIHLDTTKHPLLKKILLKHPRVSKKCQVAIV